MEKEDGFTIPEMLGVLAIIAFVISLSSYAISCSISSSNLTEVKKDASLIQQYADKMYSFDGEYPLGDRVWNMSGDDFNLELSEEFMEAGTNVDRGKLPPSTTIFGYILNSGSIYKVDKSVYENISEISDEDREYYIVYVGDTISDPVVEDELKKFNGMILTDKIYSSCEEEAYVGERGGNHFDNVPEALNFNIKR